MLQKIYNAFKYRFNLDEDKAAENEVIENIKKGVEFKGTNLWTLIFAIFIASIGLNVNSTAVIIGAMLISPIMGPIMGIGLGVGIFDFNLIKNAAKNLLIATLIGLFTSTVYFLISPLHNAQSELLARTTPTIWDVLIALFGGLAGIVASSRKKYNNVIPGVAIATALMPPLCTAGYGIATMQWSYFFGAFYLYIINSVFISISTFLIVRFLKYRPYEYVDAALAMKVKRWVGLIAFLTILPSVYLAYRFVKNEIFLQNANKMIVNEFPAEGFTILNKRIIPEKKEIKITVLDYDNLDSLRQSLEIIKFKYKLEGSEIIINSTNQSADQIPVSELREGIVENIFQKQEEQLARKNDEISALKIRIESQLRFEEEKKKAVAEFYSLYGKPNELIIEKSILNNDTNSDTVLFVFIRPGKKRLSTSTISQMQSWLKIKFSMDNVKIITD